MKYGKALERKLDSSVETPELPSLLCYILLFFTRSAKCALTSCKKLTLVEFLLIFNFLKPCSSIKLLQVYNGFISFSEAALLNKPYSSHTKPQCAHTEITESFPTISILNFPKRLKHQFTQFPNNHTRLRKLN